jgi:hypothetical protein
VVSPSIPCSQDGFSDICTNLNCNPSSQPRGRVRRRFQRHFWGGGAARWGSSRAPQRAPIAAPHAILNGSGTASARARQGRRDAREAVFVKRMSEAPVCPQSGGSRGAANSPAPRLQLESPALCVAGGRDRARPMGGAGREATPPSARAVRGGFKGHGSGTPPVYRVPAAAFLRFLRRSHSHYHALRPRPADV